MSFEVPEDDRLGNEALVRDHVKPICPCLAVAPFLADHPGQFAEILLCTPAHDMRLATPRVLELGQIRLREELGAWKLGIKALALCRRTPRPLISELTASPLVEPLGLAIMNIASRSENTPGEYLPEI